jgi:hypothetical protein
VKNPRQGDSFGPSRAAFQFQAFADEIQGGGLGVNAHRFAEPDKFDQIQPSLAALDARHKRLLSAKFLREPPLRESGCFSHLLYGRREQGVLLRKC